MSRNKKNSSLFTDNEHQKAYPIAKATTLLRDDVTNRGLLKNPMNTKNEAIPRGGVLARPLRITTDTFGNVFAKSNTILVSGVTNINMLQNPDRTNTEVAPTQRTLSRQMINDLNNGKLPKYITQNKGVSEISYKLLMTMPNIGAKLITVEIIRSLITGKRFNMKDYGGQHATKAVSYFEQMINDATKAHRSGMLDPIINTIIDKYVNSIESVFGATVRQTVPAKEIAKGMHNLAEISGVLIRLFNEQNRLEPNNNMTFEQIMGLPPSVNALMPNTTTSNSFFFEGRQDNQPSPPQGIHDPDVVQDPTNDTKPQQPDGNISHSVSDQAVSHVTQQQPTNNQPEGKSNILRNALIAGGITAGLAGALYLFSKRREAGIILGNWPDAEVQLDRPPPPAPLMGVVPQMADALAGGHDGYDAAVEQKRAVDDAVLGQVVRQNAPDALEMGGSMADAVIRAREDSDLFERKQAALFERERLKKEFHDLMVGLPVRVAFTARQNEEERRKRWQELGQLESKMDERERLLNDTLTTLQGMPFGAVLMAHRNKVARERGYAELARMESQIEEGVGFISQHNELRRQREQQQDEEKQRQDEAELLDREAKEVMAREFNENRLIMGTTKRLQKGFRQKKQRIADEQELEEKSRQAESGLVDAITLAQARRSQRLSDVNQHGLVRAFLLFDSTKKKVSDNLKKRGYIFPPESLLDIVQRAVDGGMQLPRSGGHGDEARIITNYILQSIEDGYIGIEEADYGVLANILNQQARAMGVKRDPFTPETATHLWYQFKDGASPDRDPKASNEKYMADEIMKGLEDVGRSVDAENPAAAEEEQPKKRKKQGSTTKSPQKFVPEEQKWIESAMKADRTKKMTAIPKIYEGGYDWRAIVNSLHEGVIKENEERYYKGDRKGAVTGDGTYNLALLKLYKQVSKNLKQYMPAKVSYDVLRLDASAPTIPVRDNIPYSYNMIASHSSLPWTDINLITKTLRETLENYENRPRQAGRGMKRTKTAKSKMVSKKDIDDIDARIMAILKK
jgi:hypothetical protein